MSEEFALAPLAFDRVRILPPDEPIRIGAMLGWSGGRRGTPKKVYTMEEVRTHCTAESCWLVAHGRVYDVTAYLSHHPAGAQAILRHAGKESTVDFDFHSGGAQSLWSKYCIGRVESSTAASVAAWCGVM